MKFRLISKNGESVGMALKIATEDHKVDFWLQHKGPVLKGILPQVEAWNIDLTPETIVFMDGLGGFADQLKGDGFSVYGSGKLNDALTANYEFALQVAKTSKLNLPAYGKFDNYDEAIDFVNRSKKAWVFKKEGYTYVSEDAEDMCVFLNYHRGPGVFFLQEKIEGVEVRVQGYYLDGELVSGSLNSSLPVKRLFEGDKGPRVAMGSVVWFWQKLRPKIYKLSLQKIEPFLKRFKYSGPLAVNCIVSESDTLPYFISFSTNWSIYALIEGMGNKVADFVSCLACGRPPNLQRSFDWLGSVRVSVPPYPYGAGKNIPIRGIDEHISLLDCKVNGDKTLLTAGMNGVVCEVTGSGKSLGVLDKVLNKRIEALKIPEKQYRSDVVRSAKKKIGLLKKWKYFSDK